MLVLTRRCFCVLEEPRLKPCEKAIGEVRLHPFITAEAELPAEKARSPGMRHKHYAPKAQVILVEGVVPAVMSKVKELTGACWMQNKRVGVLATDETAWAYEADVVKSYGQPPKCGCHGGEPVQASERI